MKRFIPFFLTLVCFFTCIQENACYSTETVNNQGNDFTSVAKKAIPAVVSVKVKAQSKGNFQNEQDLNDLFGDSFFNRFFVVPKKSEQQVQGQASGFIVSSDGYILTNSHVVQDATEILVAINDGREFPGKVIGHDPNTDIALIKIDAKELPFLKLGNSDKLEVGQWVIAIGNPLGLQATLTVGVVSGKGRNNLDLAKIEDFIQTDAAINRGNSGGPLLNLNAEVVGINTAIVTNMGTGGYMGIGFAIPSNIAKHDMDQLLDKGTVSRGFMGVTLQQIDHDLAQAFGLDRIEGALVADVTKESPADKAGIKQGDIILNYNGQLVTNIATLRNAISMMTPGATVTLTILHKDKTKTEIPVEIANFPTLEATAEHQDTKLGFEIQNMTPEMARSLGYHETKGVIISKVLPGSIAAWGGLKKGALISAVNHDQISNVEEFYNALKKTPSDKPILLLIKQDDMTRYISLKIG